MDIYNPRSYQLASVLTNLRNERFYEIPHPGADCFAPSSAKHKKTMTSKMSTRAQRSVSSDAGTILKKNKALKMTQNVDRRKWSLMFSRSDCSNIEKWWQELQEAYIFVLTRFHKFPPTKNDFRQDVTICQRAKNYVIKDSKRYSLSLPPKWVCSDLLARAST